MEKKKSHNNNVFKDSAEPEHYNVTGKWNQPITGIRQD